LVARSRNRCLPVAGFTTASGLRKRKKRKPYCFISKPSNAHQDVSDSLVGYTKDQEFRKQQELLTAAAQDAAHLSDIRYKGGAASYLEVLTNQTNYFTAQLNLAQAQVNELNALVQLYRALGGGWEQ
jgi:outer membrane protein TolC